MTNSELDPQGTCDICGEWHYYIYCEHCSNSLVEYEVMRRLHALATVAIIQNTVVASEIKRTTRSIINIVEGTKSG